MAGQKKRAVYAILIGLSSLIYFFVAWIGYDKMHIDLKETFERSGIITATGTDYHYGDKGDKANVFYLQLNNMKKKLGIYRSDNNYTDLLDKVKTGDSVTVFYFNNHNETENVNIDLVQVDKYGYTIIDKSEYESKESGLFYISLGAGVLTLILSVLYYKRIILPGPKKQE
ncbi:MAG: hypothetical protein JST86_11750 [Bacteroidetes bacterium]|nr:hypothetical protein [Bacteroidota bacterium]